MGGFALPALEDANTGSMMEMVESAMAVQGDADLGDEPNAAPATNVRLTEVKTIKPYGTSLQIAWKQILLPDFPMWGERKK